MTLSTTIIRRCLSTTNTKSDTQKTTALILGSSGCLGSAIAKHLYNLNDPQRIDMKIIGADVIDEDQVNDDHILSDYIQLPRTNILENSVRALHRGFDGDGDGIDVIICAAGGWMPGSGPVYGHNNNTKKKDDYLTYASNTHKLLQQNLYPTIAASSIAAAKLNPNGLFVATGALAALSPTPGMEGYGLAKAAVHHLIQSMGKTSLDTMTQLDQTYLGVLPGVLDTPSNRRSMNVGVSVGGGNDADSLSPVPEDWVRPDEIAMEIGSWIVQPYLRPKSGSLIKIVKNKKRGTMFVMTR